MGTTMDAAAAELKKKRTFRKFSYRGVDLDQLVVMSNDELVNMINARARRKFSRGLQRKAKREASTYEKPEMIKTHLRDMVVVPEMIGSVVGVYNGKVFNSVEIKPDMVGHYLGEFSITKKPVKHGKVGIGATKSSKFVPLK